MISKNTSGGLLARRRERLYVPSTETIDIESSQQEPTSGQKPAVATSASVLYTAKSRYIEPSFTSGGIDAPLAAAAAMLPPPVDRANVMSTGRGSCGRTFITSSYVSYLGDMGEAKWASNSLVPCLL